MAESKQSFFFFSIYALTMQQNLVVQFCSWKRRLTSNDVLKFYFYCLLYPFIFFECPKLSPKSIYFYVFNILFDIVLWFNHRRVHIDVFVFYIFCDLFMDKAIGICFVLFFVVSVYNVFLCCGHPYHYIFCNWISFFIYIFIKYNMVSNWFFSLMSWWFFSKKKSYYAEQ